MIRGTWKSGYKLCYLDGRRSVQGRRRFAPSAATMPDSSLNHAECVEARWLIWGRSAFAVSVVVVLVTLGVANVALYSRWDEVEDGVLWGARAEGVTAIDVLAGSA